MRTILRLLPLAWVMKAEQALYHLLLFFVSPIYLYYAAIPRQSRQLDGNALVKLQASGKVTTKEQEFQGGRGRKWSRLLSGLCTMHHSTLVLDAGCGSGEVVESLTGSTITAVGVDLNLRVLRQRHHAAIFIQGDVQGLPFKDGCFDLVYSINSFEHFPDPGLSFQELLRILKPGGYLYAAFSPLYYSPYGLHAQRRLGFAYPHLLFDDATIQNYLQAHQADLAGTYDLYSDTSKIGPYVNKADFRQFRRLFLNDLTGVRVLAYVEKPDLSGLPVLIRFPGIIKNQAPSFLSLVITSIKVLVQKNA